MERRSAARISSNEAVQITVLGDAEREMKGAVLNMSGRGMLLAIPEPLPLGAALKIKMDDALLLAEVAWAHTDGARFLAGIEIDQALMGLRDLERLNHFLIGSEARAASPATHQER